MLGDASNREKRQLVPAGAPAWMATFADLSTLLLSFFVLLLSFSEMDVNKYKEIAGSLRTAFGVQRKDFATDTPMGTSFVARNFNPGEPSSSPFITKSELMHTSRIDSIRSIRPGVPGALSGHGTLGSSDSLKRKHDAAVAQARANLIKLQGLFKEEISSGLIEVVREGVRIVIRIRERGSFPSGSAELIKPFLSAVSKIGKAIRMTRGRVVIAGHTDNIPIHNDQFRSNWDLSAARAITLLRKLEEVDSVDPKRITIAGHADTQPLVPNDTPQHRARNRRVEVILVNGGEPQKARSVDDILDSKDQGGDDGGGTAAR